MLFEIHLLRKSQDFFRFGTRHDDYTIRVGRHNVAGLHLNPVAHQRNIRAAEFVVATEVDGTGPKA